MSEENKKSKIKVDDLQPSSPEEVSVEDAKEVKGGGYALGGRPQASDEPAAGFPKPAQPTGFEK